MTRFTAALLGTSLLALAACGRKGARSSDFDSATAAALGSGAGPAAGNTANPTAPSVARVSALELGHLFDRTNRIVGGVVDRFGVTDSIMVSVRTMSATPGTALGVRLRNNGKTVDSSGTTTPAADSTGVSIVPVRFGPVRTKGTYQAEVFLDGKFQVATEFKVGQ